MCRTQCLLALLALYLGLAHSFSWDIVVGRDRQLEFLNNGIPTYTATPSPSRFMLWMTYDPVHNRVLFTNQDNTNIYVFSYHIATKETQTFKKKNPSSPILYFAYDPVTELLFGTMGPMGHILCSFLLKPGHTNNEVDGNVVIQLEKDKELFRDLAVDSCGGYIYWITDNYKIERARFNGAEREVIIDSNNLIREKLTIEAQKIADLNGNNTRTLCSETDWHSYVPDILTISKDFIYWGETTETFFWQLPKNSPRDADVKSKQISVPWRIQDLAANYKIEEQIQNCEAIKSNNDSLNVSTDASLLCVHGMKVSGKSLCECTQGYTGDRCHVSVCQNYCLQGNCSISAEGQPKCSCNTSYSGIRCEVNECQGYCSNHGNCSLNKNSEPVCQCTEGYAGERCNVSVCQNYCLQGHCSVSAEGEPKCCCNAGYSGKRCEVNICQGYCLHHGVCSLNENSEPVCQCTGDYVGERCDVPVFLIKCVQTVSLLKDILKADETPVTLGKGVKTTCASTTV